MIFNKTMKRFFYVIELYRNTGFSEKLSVRLCRPHSDCRARIEAEKFLGIAAKLSAEKRIGEMRIFSGEYDALSCNNRQTYPSIYRKQSI